MAIATAAAAMALAVIELSGLAGIVALLAPPAVLLAVIIYAHRKTRLAEPPRAAPPSEKAHGIMTAFDLPPETPDPGPPSDAPAIQTGDWPARVQAAEAAGDKAKLAEHYLGWAREALSAGDKTGAEDHLRTTVRYAAQARSMDVHAEARLELADLARDAGDLTTACEHWQLARALFHELKQTEKVGETERHMHRHGCPTDWVLNDF